MAINYSEYERKWVAIKWQIGNILSECRTSDDLDGYKFNLRCVEFFESTAKDDLDVMLFALLAYKKSPEISFVTEEEAYTIFYTLSISIYRQKDVPRMLNLLNSFIGNGDRQFSFEKYPSVWDLLCRICGVSTEYALEQDCAAAGNRASPDNISFGISYMGAVCAECRDKYYQTQVKQGKIVFNEYIYEHLKENSVATTLLKKINKAIHYSSKSIATNPKYSKYYYLLAQLLFYLRMAAKESPVSDKDKDDFAHAISDLSCVDVSWDAIVDENYSSLKRQIEKLVDQAIKNASAGNEESEKKINLYNNFLDEIKAHFTKKDRDLTSKINKIQYLSLEDCKKMVL